MLGDFAFQELGRQERASVRHEPIYLGESEDHTGSTMPAGCVLIFLRKTVLRWK